MHRHAAQRQIPSGPRLASYGKPENPPRQRSRHRGYGRAGRCAAANRGGEYVGGGHMASIATNKSSLAPLAPLALIALDEKRSCPSLSLQEIKNHLL